MSDAPALAVVDVGLVIGSGIYVAVEAADAILMLGNLQGIQRYCPVEGSYGQYS